MSLAVGLDAAMNSVHHIFQVRYTLPGIHGELNIYTSKNSRNRNVGTGSLHDDMMRRLADCENIIKTHFDRIHKYVNVMQTDGRRDRRTPHDGIGAGGAAFMHSIVRQKTKSDAPLLTTCDELYSGLTRPVLGL